MTLPTAGRPTDATVDASADAVLAALADPMRRRVLAAVAARDGDATATDIATELPITRQAVAKHLVVLTDAGLVAATRRGRELRYRVVTGSLRPAADWIQRTEASWDRRVQRLQQHLERTDHLEPGR